VQLKEASASFFVMRFLLDHFHRFVKLFSPFFSGKELFFHECFPMEQTDLHNSFVITLANVRESRKPVLEKSRQEIFQT
jgi:hypothetical protein